MRSSVGLVSNTPDALPRPGPLTCSECFCKNHFWLGDRSVYTKHSEQPGMWLSWPMNPKRSTLYRAIGSPQNGESLKVTTIGLRVHERGAEREKLKNYHVKFPELLTEIAGDNCLLPATLNGNASCQR
jgi:hypothetical protein